MLLEPKVLVRLTRFHGNAKTQHFSIRTRTLFRCFYQCKRDFTIRCSLSVLEKRNSFSEKHQYIDWPWTRSGIPLSGVPVQAIVKKIVLSTAHRKFFRR